MFLIGADGTRGHAHLHMDRQSHHRARRRSSHLDAQNPGRILDSDETHLINPRFHHFFAVLFTLPMLCWSRCNNTGLTDVIETFLFLREDSPLLPSCLSPWRCRKKRRMEGTYMPSAEERKQTASAGSEKPGLPLPLPKEERLI
ncbi:hypothetical protein PFLUV_G00006030 [Perca fluviatilis]|uniref:Uncharacterized protein n=1 Tax=Perca fluviatilis TaxID=8168 RepID=A0A6A5FJC0_PERFL|nr:hypothetical protein PFLUV_G00006030 [Perca fluviatilis]